MLQRQPWYSKSWDLEPVSQGLVVASTWLIRHQAVAATKPWTAVSCSSVRKCVPNFYPSALDKIAGRWIRPTIALFLMYGNRIFEGCTKWMCDLEPSGVASHSGRVIKQLRHSLQQRTLVTNRHCCKQASVCLFLWQNYTRYSYNYDLMVQGGSGAHDATTIVQKGANVLIRPLI